MNTMPQPSLTLWPSLQKAAAAATHDEPLLAARVQAIFGQSENLGAALARLLVLELSPAPKNLSIDWLPLFLDLHAEQPQLAEAAAHDLAAVLDRDPAAAGQALVPFLFFKGFQALQIHRLAHCLWLKSRKMLAYALQAQMSRLFTVDIHPAAQIGQAVMLDHAHGLVIGETAVVEDNVSMLHRVTLGGTGKQSGDRHPKIRQGVMIGADAKILGNIEIGAGSRIAAGSVVLKPVPPGVTVAGIPARIIGEAGAGQPATTMDQFIDL